MHRVLGSSCLARRGLDRLSALSRRLLRRRHVGAVGVSAASIGNEIAAGVVPDSVASICRTLVSWALMLSRRCVAAASSRSDSERIRSARAMASATICSAFCSDSASRLADLRLASAAVRSASARSCVDVLLGGGELLLGGGGALLEVGLGLVASRGERLLEVSRGLGCLGPLLLVDRLGLLAPGRRLAVGVVE